MKYMYSATRSIGRKKHSLCLLFLATVFATGVPVASAAEHWVSCENCDSSSSSVIAEQVAPPLIGAGMLESRVYVVNTATQTLYRYGVTTEREPGLYSRNIYPETVDPVLQQSIRSFIEAISPLVNLEIPYGEAPSVSEYMTNPFRSGRVQHWLSFGGTGFMSQVNTARAMVAISGIQAIAAVGADRGPITLQLTFSDGSKIAVEVTVGQDGLSGAPVITAITPIDGTAFDAEGNPLPSSAAGFNNYQGSSSSPQFIIHMERLATFYGIDVTDLNGCINQFEFTCDLAGKCTLKRKCN